MAAAEWHCGCSIRDGSFMQPTGPERNRAPFAIALVALAAVLLAGSASARAAWQQIARVLSLDGKPEPASANVLSAHHLEALDSMAPQAQAEFLLERAINHYEGANQQIERRLAAWGGQIEPGERFESLFRMAINSDDLRVRAAAIEIDILARKLEKNTETVDRLEPIARSGEQGPRANALWDLGLIGGRGVEQARIASIILSCVHDENVNIRYWAIEGLAYLATDDVIEPLLDIFHEDRSPMIRERAACSLAQSGMLNREQRMRAVPRLLDFAGDGALDDQTRSWVFQALRDITGENLPHDAAAWRAWYSNQR
jgi:HEAT repeat protein